MEGSSWQTGFDEANSERSERCKVGKIYRLEGAIRPTGELLARQKEERLPVPFPKEQFPGTTLLYLSVAAVRSNLVVVTTKVKGLQRPNDDSD